MGEHRQQKNKIVEEVAVQLAKVATDKGLLVELGWIGMLRYVIDKDAPQTQVDEMRKAFFMGAEHLFASIMNIMDADREITQADLARMTQIHDELELFRKQVTGHVPPARTQ